MGIAIQKMFDDIAKRYDFLNHFLSAGRDRAWRKKAVQSLAQTLQPQFSLQSPIKILDLCGGTGDFWLAWEDWNAKFNIDKPPKQIFGPDIIADFSFSMLQVARGKLKKDTINFPNILQMDALTPCLKPEIFSAVICAFGMRNLDSLQTGINSISPLLKKGGVFMTLEFFKPTSVFTWIFYHILAPLGIPLFGWFFASKREAYQYLVKSVQRFSTVSDYQKMFLSHGYNKITILPCDFGIAHIVVAVKG